jgi:Ala-tRNA(Pro) deacylase
MAEAGKVSMGSAEELMEVLGLTPGSVTPFGLVNAPPARIRFVMDAGLMRHARIWVHPLVNTASTGLTPQDLLSFLAGLGHETRLLELNGA